MRGLSLTTPWPWAILRCGKRIENRQAWTSCSYRGPIALHASNPPGPVLSWWRRAQKEPGYLGTDRQQEELHDWVDSVRDWVAWAHLDGLPAPSSVSLSDLLSMTGHIVGTASIVGVVQPSGTVVESHAVLETERHLTESERLWWMGGFALVLADVRAVEPIPCKGALGLWRLPDDVAARLGKAGS